MFRIDLGAVFEASTLVGCAQGSGLVSSIWKAFSFMYQSDNRCRILLPSLTVLKEFFIYILLQGWLSCKNR